MQLSIQEICEYDHPNLERGQNCCLICKENFIYSFPKRVPPESNTAFSLTAAKGLSSPQRSVLFIMYTPPFCWGERGVGWVSEPHNKFPKKGEGKGA